MDSGLGAVLGILFIILIVVVVLATIGFWIWTIVDCATKEPDTGNTKIVWILIILFAGIIGSIIYFFARRPKRWAELGR